MRIHLIEIEDEPWCPAPIRDAATDYLRFAERVSGVYLPIVPRLHEAIERAGAQYVLDLCSGGGGPWPQLLRALEERDCRVDVRLTDYHPNLEAFAEAEASSEGRITHEPRPVDARAVPPDLEGFRTLFTGFHHFRPDDARAILRDAVEMRRPVAVFEVTERRLLPMLTMLLMPLLVALATPFIRPFRWSRLLWTYVVPAVPLLVLWDGLVSCLRTYTLGELGEFASELAPHGYTWQIGKEPILGPFAVTYLIGLPPRGEERSIRPHTGSGDDGQRRGGRRSSRGHSLA